MEKLIEEKNHLLLIRKHGKKTVIGVFHRNCVLQEAPGQYGLYYLLDACLYNYVADRLPPEVEVHAKTYETYSGMIFCCPSPITQAVSERIYALLDGFSLEEDDFVSVKESVTEKKETAQDSALNHCFSAGFHCERFLYPVRGVGGDVASLRKEDVMKAFREQYTPKNRYVCVATAEKNAKAALKILSGHNKTPYDPARRSLPAFQGIITADGSSDGLCVVFSLPDAGVNLFAVELLCKILQNRLQNRCADAEVLYYPDYGVFSVRASRPELSAADVLRKITEKKIAAPEIAAAKKDLLLSYEGFFKDPVEFCAFSGWNAFLAQPYCIKDFCRLEEVLSGVDARMVQEILDELKTARLNW